jgi:TonB family protein
MAPNIRFWRNLTLIGLAHVALIAGLVHWSHTATKPSPQNVVWMSSGGGGDGSFIKSTPKPSKSIAPVLERTPELLKHEEIEEEHPVLASVESEIQLPKPTPKPTPRSTATPASTATPERSVSSVRKPAPKPSPKPTPKPAKKKIILAKASPKPKPTEKEEVKQTATETKPKPEPKKTESPQLVQIDKAATKVGTGGKGNSPGSGGRIGGAGGESQFGWYGSMLHDRLYSEWAQPTAVASSGEKFSVLVKLRIQKDGRVTNFEVVKPSGNETVDQSVAAVANRVTQVDPLPAGLGNGDHYDVKINFELSSE